MIARGKGEIDPERDLKSFFWYVQQPHYSPRAEALLLNYCASGQLCGCASGTLFSGVCQHMTPTDHLSSPYVICAVLHWIGRPNSGVQDNTAERRRREHDGAKERAYGRRLSTEGARATPFHHGLSCHWTSLDPSHRTSCSTPLLPSLHLPTCYVCITFSLIRRKSTCKCILSYIQRLRRSCPPRRAHRARLPRVKKKGLTRKLASQRPASSAAYSSTLRRGTTYASAPPPHTPRFVLRCPSQAPQAPSRPAPSRMAPLPGRSRHTSNAARAPENNMSSRNFERIAEINYAVLQAAREGGSE